jgi:rhodanese-related sulfurtransferase
MKDEIVDPEIAITPQALRQRLAQGVATELLDVRTPPEYAAAHLPEAKLMPLDELDAAAYLAGRPDRQQPIFLLCESGMRARKARKKFADEGFKNCVVVEGGMQAWCACNLPVQRTASRVIPLMRQVQIVVGAVNLIAAILALVVDPLFVLLPLVTGAGLLFAGLTGICGLALFLAKMPWNRRCREESCS